jgi:hypothetical protein
MDRRRALPECGTESATEARDPGATLMLAPAMPRCITQK